MQSASVLHFRRHCLPRAAASSRLRGHKASPESESGDESYELSRLMLMLREVTEKLLLRLERGLIS